MADLVDITDDRMENEMALQLAAISIAVRNTRNDVHTGFCRYCGESSDTPLHDYCVEDFEKEEKMKRISGRH